MEVSFPSAKTPMSVFYPGLDRVSSFCFWGQLGQPVEVLANSRILVVTSRVSAVCGKARPCRLQTRHGKASLKVPEVLGEPVIFPHDSLNWPRPLVTNSS